MLVSPTKQIQDIFVQKLKDYIIKHRKIISLKDLITIFISIK